MIMHFFSYAPGFRTISWQAVRTAGRDVDRLADTSARRTHRTAETVDQQPSYRRAAMHAQTHAPDAIASRDDHHAWQTNPAR